MNASREKLENNKTILFEKAGKSNQRRFVYFLTAKLLQPVNKSCVLTGLQKLTE
jgi:hypothetical protein